MKILHKFKTCLAALSIGLVSLSFTGCGTSGGGGGGGNNNDTAPATLDGLELFFIQGLPFSFQFAKIGGDATAGGENGFSNSFRPGENRTTPVVNEFGATTIYELCESMTNIAYTYVKTGPNTGVITITAQSRSNTANDLDIFSDIAEGSDIAFTINITFGSLQGVIAEIAIELVDVPSDSGDLTYTLTTPAHGVEIKTQGGNAVPVGYDENDANLVARKTPDRIYTDKFSDLGEGTMTFDNGDSYKFIGVTSDDQGFGFGVLDQGVLGVEQTIGAVTTIIATVSYAWEQGDNAGLDNIAILTLVFPDRTEKFQFTFRSFEDADFIRTEPDDAEEGEVNFPFADPDA